MGSFARQSLGSLAALVFGLLASVLLARVLGAEARGAYDLAVRLAGLILAIAQWGVPEVLLQAVGERRTETRALVGTSLGLGLAGCAGMGLLLALAAPALSDNLLKGIDPRLLLLAIGGSAVALVGLLERRFIQLAGFIGTYNVLDVARNGIFLVAAVGLANGLAWSAFGALAGWLVAEVFLAFAAGIFVWQNVAGGWRFDRRAASALLVAGVPVQVGILATFVGNEAGRYVLNARMDLGAVGVYGVALTVARLVTQVSMALRTALQPRLVGRELDSAATTTRVTRHGVLWMLLVAAGLAAGSPLVPVVFSADFAGASALLLLLLPGMVAYGLAQLLAGHLLRVGRRRDLALSSGAFAVASVLFQWLGITLYGAAGAAAGLSLAYGLMAAIVLAAFLNAAGGSIGDLLPRPADLAAYRGVLRRTPSSSVA